MLKRILVIDDDCTILDMMQMALSGAGFDVLTFSFTDDILELVERCKPNLLIFDYFLKGKNGGELCRQVKNNRFTANLPVIIFSAYPDILEFMGGYGCDAILEKPSDLSQIIATVKELLHFSNNNTLISEVNSSKTEEHV